MAIDLAEQALPGPAQRQRLLEISKHIAKSMENVHYEPDDVIKVVIEVPRGLWSQFKVRAKELKHRSGRRTGARTLLVHLLRAYVSGRSRTAPSLRNH